MKQQKAVKGNKQAYDIYKVLFGAMAICLVSSLYAAPTEPEEKDFTPEFVAQCKSKAEAGDAEAQALYGRALSNGWGVEKNPEESIKWLQKAADAGNLIGTTSLSQSLRHGHGVEKDVPKANELLAKAANQNFPRAQYLLGVFLQSGDSGISKDEGKAAEWYRKAAEQGYTDAQCDLGVC